MWVRLNALSRRYDMSKKVDQVLAEKDCALRARKMVHLFKISVAYIDALHHERQLELEESFQDVVYGLIYAYQCAVDELGIESPDEFYQLIGEYQYKLENKG